MVSEHQYIFSALSQNNNFNFNKILEIGSYDGKNALLLSKLFPNSKIKTLDLPSTPINLRIPIKEIIMRL